MYAASNYTAVGADSGAAGVEGATLNAMIGDLLNNGGACVPKCALDAGLDCGP
jgi:hypothetical protein